MTDSGGTARNSCNYGACGEIRNQTTIILNNYGYTGREFSEDILYYYKARYMDSDIGRFISEDPIGFEGGINLYSYVFNNPIKYIDSSGMIVYNTNDTNKTGRLKGEALKLALCMEKCIGNTIMVTGGSEKQGHRKGSKHYTDQAFDMWPNSHNKTKVFCCAVECGAQFAIEENKGKKSWHWNFQTPKGRLGSSGELPTKEECKCIIKK